MLTLAYEQLHRRTRERDRSLRVKVMSLAEAAALVPDAASASDITFSRRLRSRSRVRRWSSSWVSVNELSPSRPPC